MTLYFVAVTQSTSGWMAIDAFIKIHVPGPICKGKKNLYTKEYNSI